MRIYFKKHLYIIVLTLVSSLILVACGAPVESQGSATNVLPGASRLSELLGDGDVEGYAKAMAPRTFQFPLDHGPHPEFRNEWWYITGNLDGVDGERFGYELTIFRFSLTPVDEGLMHSQWQSNQVYVGHFAITDVGAEKFHVAQRYSRGSIGLAGARADPFRVWLDDWSVATLDNKGEDIRWRLRAKDRDVELNLELLSLKAPVLNGEGGLSQKSAKPGNASYYYSLTRLQTNGTLRIEDQTYAVSGNSWLDREWSSSTLSGEQAGWDWFALQLSDGSELMFYQLRGNDGSIDEHSAGTWNNSVGSATYLGYNDVVLSVTGKWTNEQGSEYPAAWQLDIPSLNLQLEILPVMANQELVTNIRYWEGAVDATGILNGQPLVGRGYVELTGYAEN